MFFQVNITPKANKNVEAVQKSEKETFQYSLVLAPFQPQTKIELKTFVNTSVECHLDIKNITDKPIDVNVTKQPAKDKRILLSSLKERINARDFKRIYIKWSPVEACSWRDLIQLTDNRRIKYEISLVASAKMPFSEANRKTKTNRTHIASTSRSTINESKLAEKSNEEKLRKSTCKFFSSEKIQNKENIYDRNFHRPPTIIEEDFSTPVKKHDADDFSKMVDNNFALTPLKASPDGRNIFQAKPEFSPQELKSFNTENSSETLRRETYVIPTDIVTDCINLPNISPKTESFEDSLSPVGTKGKSEFSIAVDNLSLSITNLIHSPQDPQSCNKTKVICKVEKATQDETFDITDATSPVASTSFVLSRQAPISFGSISPVIPATSSPQPHKGNLSSSSPIFDTINRKSCSIKLSSRYSDNNLTVKEVLQANLWVNSGNKSLTPIIEDLSMNMVNTVKTDNQLISKRPRKESGVSLVISPPKRIASLKASPIRKASPKKIGKAYKDKIFLEDSVKKKFNTPLRKREILSNIKSSSLSLSSLKCEKKSVQAAPKEVSVKLHDPNDLIAHLCRPDLFGATVTEDPFLVNTLYYDNKWICQQEIIFKKWLNTLLSPPEHLTADIESTRVDIGKVWQSCRSKENSILAESKEVVSARYHTDIRLNTLRKAACAMFRRDEVVQVLSKTTVSIEKGLLIVRSDKDLHRDVGLQKTILELFLSYNPLWLRIGLETIYGETIPLQSNDDLIGLTRFLLTRFFSDPFISKSFVHPYLKTQPGFISQMNKFMLKKFLLLIYFLDYAKMHKLIGHDPCLFHKKATHKDSRSILLTFSREVLSGIGDITKVLKAYNYIVLHKQTYLEEYDYAVKELSTDLRDGVRLCRVMELMSGTKDITQNCRVPAISRLQKIHNVEVALKAFKFKCGYTLTGGINSKNIADGHREKTLSLLWQIIYKYQAPKFEKACLVIQKWWRANLYYIRVKIFLKNRKINAACVIQRAWKCYSARQQLDHLRTEYRMQLAIKEKAVRLIQLHWRRNRIRKISRENFLKISESVKKIQKWWRNLQDTKPYRIDFQAKRCASIFIQRKFRATIAMRLQVVSYSQMREAATIFQIYWRARVLGKSVRDEYLQLKRTTIFVQRKWRAKKLMKIERQDYLRKLNAVRRIQFWWEGILKVKLERLEVLLKKCAVMVIEEWWLDASDIKSQRNKEERAAIRIQSWWKSVFAQSNYRKKQSSCIKLQNWWRSLQTTEQIRAEYLLIRETSTKIQRLWRAKKIRQSYLRQKAAAITIQQRYRCLKMGRAQRENYLHQRSAAIVIQNRWRNKKLGEEIRKSFLERREAAVKIQRSWRTKKARESFLKKKHAVQVIQNRYRSMKIGKIQRRNYLLQKSAATFIQLWWKNIKVTEKLKHELLEYHNIIIHLEKVKRAVNTAKYLEQLYVKRKGACLKIENWWIMVKVRKHYKQILQNRNNSAIILQRKWRATKLRNVVRADYVDLKDSVIKIQRRWRNRKMYKEARNHYLQLCSATILVQNRWRATVAGRKQRNEFLLYKKSAICIQERFRALRIGRETRGSYLNYLETIIFVQRKWRAKLAARETRDLLKLWHTSATKIKSYWKMTVQQHNYLVKKHAALIIQSYWRSIIIGRKVRRDYMLLKKVVIFLQRRHRSKCQFNNILREENHSATIIQAAWKGYRIRKNQSEQLSDLRERCEKAKNAALPTSTLAYRCEESINILQNCNSIGELSMCLASIDTITRISPKGCINLCKFDIVDRVYNTLLDFNRSLPWVNVCVRGCSILITLTKFSATRHYVALKEHASTIAMLINSSTQFKELFLHLVTLLWLLCEDESYAKNVVSSPRVIWLLSSAINKIQKKRLKTPRNTRMEESFALPSVKSDWGLKQKRPRIFEDVNFAVSTIMKQLKIAPTS